MKKAEDASGSGQGYLYQFLLGLNLALKKCRDMDDLKINIENFDDISFLDNEGTPLELIQSKHKSKPKNLGNASLDLWKTLSIWLKNDLEDVKKDNNLKLYYLVTNSKASSKSAMEYLSAEVGKRNLDEALSILIETANNSQNVSTQVYRNDFLLASDKSRKSLLSRIYVLDESPGIKDLSKDIQSEFLSTVMDKHRPLVAERIISWWLSKVIVLLSDSQLSIPIKEIEIALQNICYEYHNENLPIDCLLLEPDNSAWDDKIFVQQLKFVTEQNERIKDAIRDYYRAYNQRLKWAREDLLVKDELDIYELKLINEWRRFRNAKIDEYGTSEEAKKKCGILIYNWMELEAKFPIRKYVDEPYVMRGSYHMLAEDQKIGWHPDFIEKLKEIFGV